MSGAEVIASSMGRAAFGKYSLLGEFFYKERGN
jgi:hypothetical protein